MQLDKISFHSLLTRLIKVTYLYNVSDEKRALINDLYISLNTLTIESKCIETVLTDIYLRCTKLHYEENRICYETFKIKRWICYFEWVAIMKTVLNK